MKFGGFLRYAALCSIFITWVAAFGEGGTLPDDHFIYGPMGSPGAVDLAKRAKTTSSSTSSASTAACTFGPSSRNCWSNGYSVATDFDQKWPTTGVTRYVSFPSQFAGDGICVTDVFRSTL